MDTSSSSVLNYNLWFSDSDLSSISSSEAFSPSLDSSVSPSYRQLPQSSSKPEKRGRKSGRGNRIRSKQRESASEKEKMRMRDLTKALHHLRSYLPPSVAPAGQTLTKIETLRLTINYISHLSSQLGLSEEELFQRKEQGDTSASDTSSSSPDILGYFQHGSSIMGAQELQGQNQSLYPAQVYSGSCSFGVDQYSRQYYDAPQGDGSLDAVLQSPPTTQTYCQMSGKEFRMPLVPREYWG
ncbi:hypothetical protein CesoFtcFv8_000525 [Champsocephalus esox]|uniref:BHLH domain-containing protein n=2 Tax=Champsocephalus TaxID=52236 RepID=A0AAN8I0R0_CHAGU|nr:hypothetical protein CesoFtcFv8_000525 [Champsocephalus esox]KAK5934838.1 hypothetical protein CgunFtcFv8_020257 [Champsocephalus gunnari]